MAYAALPDRLRAHLRRTRVFPEPGTAVVAVSGGPDSVALLDLLSGLAPELGLHLVVAHVDHGIRADSRTVGQAVRELAEQYGLPFELGELRLGPAATETEARRARYAWLTEVRRRHSARYLVTAHHRDDQVETVLMRFLRGSAPAGLAGMPARGRGGLVRPLLPFARAELAAHVAARGLTMHEDPANRDPRHLRSWVRTVLLPLVVERLGPGVEDDLLRASGFAAAERCAWDGVLELLPRSELHVAAESFDVARDALARYDNALSVALLRAAARRVGLVLGPGRALRLLRLATRSSGRQMPLGAGWVAEAAFDRVRVSRSVGCAAERVVATAERGSAPFGGFRISWELASAPERLERGGWSTWVVGPGWEVRAPRAGDRLVPLGGVGRRPLRRLLMEARVPRGRRATYPVVARGKTILWVPGICRSADELPQPGTPAVRLNVVRDGEP
ncbi:MAG: tRNA lysidine(34) synthetase TilS [Gemmatimonadetes bacterium]|nr:tRNA lysidine(34) synthetase TilS [Gemmatimonadota bacterium]